MSGPGQLVVRLLTAIGKPNEAQLYLSLFRAQRPESFAVIWVDPDVTDGLADALVVDLELLAELGLTPILAFPSSELAHELARALPERVRGEVVSVAAAAEVTGRGGIPLCPLDGDSLSDLAARVDTRKVILLGSHGALVRAEHRLSIVDLISEREQLLAAGILSEPHRALLERACNLVDTLGPGVTVAITSPLDLLRELFTVRGAGTMVRRGTEVSRHRDLSTIDRARLAAVIEAAFGRPLADGFWQRPLDRVYIAGDYRGAALVAPTELGPYLTKLAVDTQARGEGIGRDLWRALTGDFPVLYWRARAQNPITNWYRDQCDGMVKLGEWNVYWRGLDPEAISRAVAWARAAPVDL